MLFLQNLFPTLNPVKKWGFFLFLEFFSRAWLRGMLDVARLFNKSSLKIPTTFMYITPRWLFGLCMNAHSHFHIIMGPFTRNFAPHLNAWRFEPGAILYYNCATSTTLWLWNSTFVQRHISHKKGQNCCLTKE